MSVRAGSIGTALATALLSATIACASTVIYIDTGATGNNDGTSWQDAYSDLQDALAEAAGLPAPVQLWIAAGEYKPGPPDAGPEVTFQLVSSIQLYGGFAGGEQSLDERDWEKNETILSGDLNGDGDGDVEHVLVGMDLADGTLLDGIIIRDGFAIGDHGDTFGGGLWIVNSMLHIENCSFINNRAIFDGGAIFAEQSHMTLVNSRFLSNWSVDLGGAIAAPGGTLEINDCEFINNTTGGIGLGGGIWAEDALVSVVDTLFHQNAAGSAGIGGAAYVASTKADFINCTFTGNSGYGGGVFGAFGGSLTLLDCTLTDNTFSSIIWGSGELFIADTHVADNAGMAIEWANGTAVITRSTFIGNGCTSSECGDVGGLSFVNGTVNVQETTFHDNISGFSGGNIRIVNTEASFTNCRITAGHGGTSSNVAGGLIALGESDVTAVNCLFSDNRNGIRIGGSLGDTAQATFINCNIINNDTVTHAALRVSELSHADVQNTIIWGHSGSPTHFDTTESAQVSGPATVRYSIVEGLDLYDGPGNSDDDPLLADADGRLGFGSPAIDAGNDNFVPADVQTDLDDNPRFVDGTGDGFAIVDIGAFEFQGIPGDLNGDGVVDVSDLLILLGAWGSCSDCNECPADLNGDCTVDVSDMLILLSAWTGH